MCILAGSLWGSLFLLLPAGKSRMDFQVEKGVTKVSTEDTASKVDVSLKHGTAQLGRVPDAQGSSLDRLPAPSGMGRYKQVLEGVTGHLR